MAFDIRDPKYQKSFLGIVGGAVILYGYFFTDLLPFTYKANAQELTKLEDQYRELSKDLTKARQAAHQLPYLEKEFNLLHRKWEQGQSMLPEKVEMTVLLRTITLLGNQTGVEFVKFKPNTPVPGSNFTENPVEISVVGGYHQVGAFLAEIANLDRIVNVRDLEVDANKEKNADLGKQPAQASFVAVAYTVGQEPPPPPPAEKKSGVASAKSGKAKGKAEGKKTDSKKQSGKKKGKTEASDE
ncbi:MAG: type 4a pilus biogenesis protein PilO [Candidatus Eisenbacteria bacterium]